MVDKHGFHTGCNYVGIVLEDENIWFCNKCGNGGAIYIWVVTSYWGPGSMDSMVLIASAWTNEEEAKKAADARGGSISKIRINSTEGWNHDQVSTAL